MNANTLPSLTSRHSPVNGLLWGFDFAPGGPVDVALDTPRVHGQFRWLHFSLADNGTRLWVEAQSGFSPAVREALLGHDTYQNSFVEADTLACVLQDLQRDFEVRHTDRVGTLHVALRPDLMVTARLHPLGFADILRRRLHEGAPVNGPERALDHLCSAIIENQSQLVASLSNQVQKAEDAVLAGLPPPSSRTLLEIRRRLAIIHRMIDGTQRVFLRLEDDEDLADTMHPTVEKLSQRMQGLDEDVMGIQAQVRLLRDELELLSNQRINRNLYILSVMTVLLMPATLVTGFFGMNTGALPFAQGNGTLIAGVVAAGSSLAAYLFLRSRDFF
jgi:zinc transporter